MQDVNKLEAIYSAVVETERIYNVKNGSTCMIAVSKTRSDHEIKPILNAGQRHFGENRVQEAANKWFGLRQDYPDIKLHLIGPLQSNKATQAVSTFDMIHTLDREKIAKVLANEMKKQERNLPCTIQINTGAEPQKAGIDPTNAQSFLSFCRRLELNITGLMCIPPVDENPGPHFALLQKMGKDMKLDTLSMGMSGDFETAIQFGATHIRVGSAIFGPRV